MWRQTCNLFLTYSSIHSSLLRSSESERSAEMSNVDEKEDWAKDSGKLMKSVWGRLMGGGAVSRDSRDSDSEGMFWPNPPPKQVLEAEAPERDWGLGGTWELGRSESRESFTGRKCFEWICWWYTGEPAAGLENRADKWWSLRASRDGRDVPAEATGRVQVDVAPSCVVKGGESPRNIEWEARSGLKESECAEVVQVEVDLQRS